MLEEHDKKEAENILLEEKLSVELFDKLRLLENSSNNLYSTYKELNNTGKKLLNIIKKKERQNETGLQRLRELRNKLKNSSVARIQSENIKIKESEIEEKNLSREEAIILQSMLNSLQEAHKKSQVFASKNVELYNLMKSIYQKDLEDYNLETEDLAKA